ncbi:LysE family translocator [Dickeya dadantii]|uniref:hypothetical protein n=1 Tax=Dickeya dadantii TaxID=204038 RepID=UPI0021D9E020|nr:hypothetical protein [Dickeya dadantii]
MASDILAIAAIGGVLALGAMSPGQSFILVARTALASSRRTSLAVSLGMGAGAAIFALVALLLSSSRPRSAYLRFKKVFDRLSGSVMAVLGIRLLLQK